MDGQANNVIYVWFSLVKLSHAAHRLLLRHRRPFSFHHRHHHQYHDFVIIISA